MTDPLDPRLWVPPRPQIIYLNGGLECVVDEIDYSYLARNQWHASNSRGKRYATRKITVDDKRIHVFLHKEILLRMGSPQTDLHYIGDHMDGNEFNCLRSNLRWSTVLENNQNRHGFYVKQTALAFPKRD